MAYETNDNPGEINGCNSSSATNATRRENTVTTTAGNAPDNEELVWARKHVPADPATLIIERKTELIGWGVPSRQRKRQLTAEAMIDRVVIPVIERMQKDLIRRIDAIDARITALERVSRPRKERNRPGTDERGDHQ